MSSEQAESTLLNVALAPPLASGTKRKVDDDSPASCKGYEICVSPTTVYPLKIRGGSSPPSDQASSEWNYHNQWTPTCAANLFNNNRNNWRTYHRNWLKQGGIEKLNSCDSGAALNQLLVEFHENTKHGRQSIWTIVSSALQMLGVGTNAKRGYTSWSALEKRNFHDTIMMLQGKELGVVKVALSMRLRQVPGATDAISKLVNSTLMCELLKPSPAVGSSHSFEAGILYTAKPCAEGYADSYWSPGVNLSGYGGVGINPNSKTTRSPYDNPTNCSPRNLFCEAESAPATADTNF
jgi:hypothetical protein